MKIYRNINSIQGKEKTGRRLSLAGLLVLLLGLFINFTPNLYPATEQATTAVGLFLQRYWTLFSLASLLGGFLLASTGSYYINRFARRRWPGSKFIERPDELLERNMKGFDDKYAYFAHSLPAAYTLLGPCGILLFTIRNDKGRVIASGDKWREPFNLSRLFTMFAREGVGNPERDLADQEKKLRALLAQADGELQTQAATLPIDGAAVFLNPDVQLEVDGASVTVLRGDQLKDHVRRKAKDVKLAPATLRSLNDFLVANAVYQEAESS